MLEIADYLLLALVCAGMLLALHVYCKKRKKSCTCCGGCCSFCHGCECKSKS